MKNYYEILEIEPTATQEDIKKSFRKLSLLNHPDRNGNTAESTTKMQDITEAYEVLGNQESRARYDNERNGVPMNDIGVDINDLFSSIFQMNGTHPNGFRVFFNGQPMNSSQFNRPPPIVQRVVIPFEKVLMNLKIPVEITRTIQEENNKTTEKETIYVDIPRGIDNGEILLVKEKGNITNNLKGDVKIFVQIENNTEFKRVGLDIVYLKTISLKEALCGFTFELKHLDGKIYTITNSSTPGHVIHPNYQKLIPNMGLTRENYVGNLVIIFNVTFPEQLNEQVLEQLKCVDF